MVGEVAPPVQYQVGDGHRALLQHRDWVPVQYLWRGASRYRRGVAL